MLLISPRFACHQRLTSSGVVHALYTRWAGASNSLVMRICSSVGSVTAAFAPLVTAISLLLPFEFIEDHVELIEPLAPQLLVVLDPVVNGLERLAVAAVQAPTSVVSHLDSSHLSEHP